MHTQGRSPAPGLHWIGLPWQTRLNSGIIDGIDRDARALADRVARALPVDAAEPPGPGRPDAPGDAALSSP